MINNVVLMGRLVANPELKATQSGVEVLSFTVALDRGYQRQGEQKQTDFIDCVAWRNTAVFISKYFNKGSMIALTGEIQTRSYEDKNGNKRKAVEVVVSSASFCGSKSETGGAPNLDVSPPDFEEVGGNDDLPF